MSKRLPTRGRAFGPGGSGLPLVRALQWLNAWMYQTTTKATRAEVTRVRRDGENVDMACWSSPRENGRSLSPSSETPCARARAITSRSSPLVSDRQYRWCQSKRRSTCALSSLWDPHQCLSGQGSEIVKGTAHDNTSCFAACHSMGDALMEAPIQTSTLAHAPQGQEPYDVLWSSGKPMGAVLGEAGKVTLLENSADETRHIAGGQKVHFQILMTAN